MKATDLKEDDLKTSNWIGIVEDVDDPLFEGRCRIRVFGKMDQREGDANSNYVIPTDSLPWARPQMNSLGGSVGGGGSFSIPKLGSVVRVYFDNGNLYSPVYTGHVYPSNDLKSEIEDSYKNSHVLIYDTEFGLTNNNGDIVNEREGESIKVYFKDTSGFNIKYTTNSGEVILSITNENEFIVSNSNGDSIEMLPDGNINLNHSGTVNINCSKAVIKASDETHINSPKIKLGKTAAESIIKGDTFAQIFNQHTHVGNMGAPTSPPLTVANPALSNKNSTD